MIAIVLSFGLVGLLLVFVYLVLSRILKRDFITSADIENDSCKQINFFSRFMKMQSAKCTQSLKPYGVLFNIS